MAEDKKFKIDASLGNASNKEAGFSMLPNTNTGDNSNTNDEMTQALFDLGMVGQNTTSANFGTPESEPTDLEQMAFNFGNMSSSNLKVDPLENLKNVRFDADDVDNTNQFYERYAQHADFEDHGFNPFRDNESLYNSTSSFANEVGRAWGGMTTLVGIAFKDSLPGANFFQGDGALNFTDVDAAEGFEKAMAVGNSTKGGVGGFTANLFLNSGYTVGILAELAVEETALAAAEAGLIAATGATVGGTAPLLAANTALMASRFMRGIKKIGTAWKQADKLKKVISSFKDVGKFRDYYKLANLKKVGSFLGDAITPSTVQYAKMLKAGQLDGMNAILKSGKGLASAYRDFRNINLAWGEGALEGGMVQNKVYKESIAQWKRDNPDKPLTDEIAQGLALNAREAGVETTMWNAPAIMLSNGITFDGLLKTKFNRGSSLIDTRLGKILFNPKKGGTEAVKEAFTVAGKSVKSGAMNYWKNPTLALKSLGKYGKANLAEGFQELYQESITAATESYYMDRFKKGTMVEGGYMANNLDYLLKGMGEQVSHQGLETFASGFLMGGMIAPISASAGRVTNAVRSGGQGNTWLDKGVVGIRRKMAKAKGEEALQEFDQEQTDLKAAKDKQTKDLDKIVEQLNTIYKDPTVALNPNIESLKAQTFYKAAMKDAEKNGDTFNYYNAKDDSFNEALTVALRMGRMGAFKERINDMSQMTDKELEEFGHTNESYNKLAKDSLDFADQIETFNKKVKEDYPNPHNPDKYSRKTQPELHYAEVKAKEAWEKALDFATFNQASFMSMLNRQEKMMKVFPEMTGLENGSYQDLNALMDKNKLNNDIEALTTELAGLKGNNFTELSEGQIQTPELKKIIKEKEEKLKLLEEFKKIDSAENKNYKTEAPGRTMFTEQITDYNSSFNKYINWLAAKNGKTVSPTQLREAFETFLDMKELDANAKEANAAVNQMLDPTQFQNVVKENRKQIESVMENNKTRIKDSLKAFKAAQIMNDLFNRLADKNMFISPEEARLLKEEGIAPKEVFYLDKAEKDNMGEVYVNSDDYYKAIDIIKDHHKELVVKDILIYQDVEKAYQDRYGIYKQSVRTKGSLDKRSFEDLANQYGFNEAGTRTVQKTVQEEVEVDEEYEEEIDISKEQVELEKIRDDALAEADKMLERQLAADDANDKNADGTTVGDRAVEENRMVRGLINATYETDLKKITPVAQSTNEVSKMTQDEFANYIVENLDVSQFTQKQIYDLLTTRPELREAKLNESLEEWSKRFTTNKEYKAAATNIANSKEMRGNSNPAWTSITIGDATNKETDGRRKGYVTIPASGLSSFTENLEETIEELYKNLTEAGYNGHLKFASTQAALTVKFDNLVVHGATAADVDIALEVIKNTFKDKIEIENTSKGLDVNNTSHTDNLAKQVKEGNFKTSNQETVKKKVKKTRKVKKTVEKTVDEVVNYGTTRKVNDVLREILNSPNASKREKAAAQALLNQEGNENATITFAKDRSIPVEYNSTEESIVDVRFASDEYRKDTRDKSVRGLPIEHLILESEIRRRTALSAQNNPDYIKKIQTIQANMLVENLRNVSETPFTVYDQSPEDFVISVMLDPKLQRDMSMVASSKEGKTEDEWVNFVDSTMDALANQFGPTNSEGTVLNEALNLITATPEEYVEETVEEVSDDYEVSDDVDRSFIVNALKGTDVNAVELKKQMVAAFRKYNEDQVAEGNDGVEGLESMSDKDILKSSEFESFVMDVDNTEVDDLYSSIILKVDDVDKIDPKEIKQKRKRYNKILFSRGWSMEEIENMDLQTYKSILASGKTKQQLENEESINKNKQKKQNKESVEKQAEELLGKVTELMEGVNTKQERNAAIEEINEISKQYDASVIAAVFTDLTWFEELEAKAKKRFTEFNIERLRVGEIVHLNKTNLGNFVYHEGEVAALAAITDINLDGKTVTVKNTRSEEEMDVTIEDIDYIYSQDHVESELDESERQAVKDNLDQADLGDSDNEGGLNNANPIDLGDLQDDIDDELNNCNV